MKLETIMIRFKKIRLSKYIFVFILFVLFFGPVNFPITVGDINTINEAKTSISSEEDPYARINFELLRTINPQTGKLPDNIRFKEIAFAEKLNILNKASKASGARKEYSWSRRGPFNLGGRTRALAIDVLNDDIFLAGGVSGGMWRSDNGGISWTKVTAAHQLHSVSCITQDTRPGKTNIWYYGTGEFVGNSATGLSRASYKGDGIFKSTDNGVSWQKLITTEKNTPHLFNSKFNYIWKIAVDPSNSEQDEIYAAVYSSIYRSIDGGQTWNAVLVTNQPYSSYTDVVITEDGVVYAYLSSENNMQGIWRSTDGLFWTKISINTPIFNFANRTVLALAPSNQNILYMLTNVPGQGKNDHALYKYVYNSGDGTIGNDGNTLIDMTSNLPDYDNDKGGTFNSQGSYNQLIKVHPSDENLVFIGGVNLYRSTDGFLTPDNISWIGGHNYQTGNRHHADQHELVFSHGTNTFVLSGHDGGISKTENIHAENVKWESLNSGYLTTQYYTVAIAPGSEGNALVAGGMQDNGTWFTSTEGAEDPWSKVLGGDGGFVSISKERNAIIASYQNGKIYRYSIESDGTLGAWSRIDPEGGSNYLFVSPFVQDPNIGNLIYLAAGKYIWKNSDLTKIPTYDNKPTKVNWDKLSFTNKDAVISSLAISKEPANILYYGTTNGKIFKIQDISLTNPSPVSIWRDKGLPNDGYVSCIKINPNNADNAVAVFSNYSIQSIFSTEDGGHTWANVSGNLEENPDGTGSGPSVRWVELLPLHPDSKRYFAATSTGLYSALELNGQNTLWIQEGINNIGNIVVNMVEGRTIDGFVAVATHGGGVFTAYLKEHDNVDPTAPTILSLKQNFPNPFNQHTTIEFVMSQTDMISIKIYSVTGKLVKTLIENEEFENGLHTISFTSTNNLGIPLASGVYIYQISSGNSKFSKKMLFIK